ncbi:DciA family protein [Corynebacterium uberis]|uniref:DciA family protein n=1 Tax=Corynebacterium TaxID=1716 RepID=UPI001D0BCA86|nr:MULTISPECIES: DciA family protein [Corynebacterium]MCZ9310146.1 DciA family protein [Corynebacterium sp. c6VSa_13]UDL73287.1 DciA family protein [Corynebacterium uberis]UDL75835.1 DciA family protein [Corynebacterium uberis]UDL78048.1 DciA family protein [Corynebacterium uberis]UDL80330.1 DciA family protein [Corynebacterium uberis]
MTDQSDPIDQAFAAMRAAAKRRGGTVPRLGSKQGSQRRKRSEGQLFAALSDAPSAAPSAPISGTAVTPGVTIPGVQVPAGSRRRRGRGMPTGRDGRRIPRSRDVDKLGAILGAEISRRGWGRGIAGGWVAGHWEELVGPKIAAHATVEMIKGTTLFITCDSTAWATNLRLMQRQILQTIRGKVGADVITELKIFGPKAPSWRKGPLHVKGRGPRDTYG